MAAARRMRPTARLASNWRTETTHPKLHAQYRRDERYRQDEPGKELGGIDRRWWLGGFIVASIVSDMYIVWLIFKPECADSSTIKLEEMKCVTYNLQPKNLMDAQKELTELLGEDRIVFSVGERVARSSTEWSPAPGGSSDMCSFIVYPTSTEEVSAIAKICHARDIPMIPFSGGTSLEGTLACITKGGCCIDFRWMNKVVEVHQKDMDVVVQPGIGYQDLNALLEPQGLFFPPDPGPGAQIGGMISQGCSGTNAYRYGTVKDWVLGLTIVLADGTIVRTRGRPRKSSAGYNLTQLMVGSEGTLGIAATAVGVPSDFGRYHHRGIPQIDEYTTKRSRGSSCF